MLTCKDVYLTNSYDPYCAGQEVRSVHDEYNAIGIDDEAIRASSSVSDQLPE